MIWFLSTIYNPPILNNEAAPIKKLISEIPIKHFYKRPLRISLSLNTSKPPSSTLINGYRVVVGIVEDPQPCHAVAGVGNQNTIFTPRTSSYFSQSGTANKLLFVVY